MTAKSISDPRICVGCGDPVPLQCKQGTKFCSPKCGNAHAGKLRTLAAKTERHCTECLEIIPIETRKDQTVCSDACSLARTGRQTKASYRLKVYATATPTPEQRKGGGSTFWRAQALGFRSGLEVRVAEELKAKGIDVVFEGIKVRYTPPLKERSYTPDFPLPNGIIVETKGRFLTEDRVKHKVIKAEHPDLDIRFVFAGGGGGRKPTIGSTQRLSKTSKTTYAMWCEQYGFQYADISIPQAWIDEPFCKKRFDAIAAASPKRKG